MQRNPGWYARSQGLARVVWVVVALAGAIGLFLGGVLNALLAPWIDTRWLTVACVIPLALLLAFVPAYRKVVDRWFDGADAETRIGQLIAYWIRAEGCAVAHGVMDVAKFGDIDHLVATRRSLWIVETKLQRILEKHFPQTLSVLAANTKAVRSWAGTREGVPTRVRACLVLANATKPTAVRLFHRDGEEIVAYTKATLGELAREIREETCGEQSLDPEVARRVVALSRIPEEEPAATRDRS